MNATVYNLNAQCEPRFTVQKNKSKKILTSQFSVQPQNHF